MDEGRDESVNQPLTEPNRVFTGRSLAAWHRACERLEGAGYGQSVCDAYRRASLVSAHYLGSAPVIAFADTISTVAIKAGRRAAEHSARVAPDVSAVVDGADEFETWSRLIRQIAKRAPKVLPLVSERSAEIVSRLGISRLQAWCEAGLAGVSADDERLSAYFSLRSAESRRVLESDPGDLSSSARLPRLRVYQQILFGVSVPIQESVSQAGEGATPRPSFDRVGMTLPASYSGQQASDRERLEQAAVAHVGAHLRFSTQRFPVRRRKPLKIALLSVLEDARVEALAMAETPGLRRLWAPFHVMDADGPRTAESMLHRLAYALLDPDWRVADTWIRKAQILFFDNSDRWDDPELVLDIGNGLSHDLGQMRVQFNARGYVVQPPYRDDNLGLWEPDNAPPPDETHHEVVTENARVSEQLPDDAPSTEQDDDRMENAGSQSLPQVDELVPLAALPEWDAASGVYRPEWVTIQDEAPVMAELGWLGRLIERRQRLITRVETSVAQKHIGRMQRLRRQPEGEDLDIDAALEAMINLRTGDMPDDRIYQRHSVVQRDLAISVLLDASESTRDPANSRARVIDIERDAVAVLGHVIERSGDAFDIQAFRSNGRDEVRMVLLKSFDEPFGTEAGCRIGGLEPQLSTRLGSGMRWVGRGLTGRAAYRRLVLVITDGEPSDIDCDDRAYLVEDAWQARRELASEGIDVFGVVVGDATQSQSVMARVFGAGCHVCVDSLEQLPEHLAMLYLRLTQ